MQGTSIIVAYSLGFERRISLLFMVLDNQLYRVGMDAARRKFSPEFMNRLDKVVVFRRLTDESMREILELELRAVQRRILKLAHGRFILHYTDEARSFLLARGTSARYGARELKRTIERHVVLPLSNLVATKQIREGDILLTDLAKDEDDLVLMKRHIQPIAPRPYDFSYDRIGTAAAMATVAR